MWLANLIGGCIVLFTGLIVRIFKAANLIAGYNTLSEKEKEKYDTVKLTKYVGNMLILSAAILLTGALLESITPIGFIIISVSWVMFILFILIGVIYMNIGNKFKK